MPDPTSAAFISYSRKDSEFALRLARDLKDAGASVWLDQIDIEPGLPWDNAIEEALMNAPQMLLILSPWSSKSDNVRNELSFALDAGKMIVPVLYRECVVPLRLQRTQHIDFRADYAQGLAALLAHLKVVQPDPAVLQRAAEGDAHRQAAWQARETVAQKLRGIADRIEPEDNGAATSPGGEHLPTQPTRKSAGGQSLRIPGAIAAILIVAAAALFAYRKYEDQPPRKMASLRRQCDKGSAFACVTLAGDLDQRANDPRELHRSTEVLIKGCDLGNSGACQDAGNRFDYGIGAEKNPGLAASYYRRSCDGDDLAACSLLALHYQSADGVPQDLDRARTLFQKACAGLLPNDPRSAPLSCVYLGILYQTGSGVPRDDFHAATLFQRACFFKNAFGFPSGVPDGCVRLGSLYESGDGIPKDIAKANTLYRRACEGGSASGCLHLANAAKS